MDNHSTKCTRRSTDNQTSSVYTPAIDASELIAFESRDGRYFGVAFTAEGVVAIQPQTLMVDVISAAKSL